MSQNFAFLAFPQESSTVFETLNRAAELSHNEPVRLVPWTTQSIYGLKIDDLVRENIESCAYLAADITYPNFNVFYEIGYALGKGKPIILLVCSAIAEGKKNAQMTGLFDNIGYLLYENSADLVARLDDWEKKSFTEKYERPLDNAQPLFVLDTLIKSNFRHYIFEEIGHRSVKYRSFDPFESPRFTSAQAMAEITSSVGCIIPLLHSSITDALNHNLRGGFLAGLAQGIGINPLIIQENGGPAPADFRDYITNTKGRTETHRHIGAYCANVLINNQKRSNRDKKFQLGLVNQINIGRGAAENESESLFEYFVETAQYTLALNSDHAVVTGRKGSGKTAIFYVVRDEYLKDPKNLVIDLRPAAHGLSDLRHELEKLANSGLRDHTAQAMWQHVLYQEVLLAVRERVLPAAERNYDLLKQVADIETDLNLDVETVSVDFTDRFENSISKLIEAIKDSHNKDESVREFTATFFDKIIPKTRDAILNLHKFYSDIVILIDDLDKGWPPQSLDKQDVVIVRHLIEALRKIERELRNRGQTFKSMVFLRSDVYENLVDVTSDRNKQNVVRIDWSDTAQLSYLMKQRVVSAFADDSTKEEAWEAFNPILSDGRHAIDHLVNASLYRPRFLIDLSQRVLARTVNRGAAYVSDDDIELALDEMSLYLISDFGFEVRDVSGIREDLFYLFIGCKDILTKDEIVNILDNEISGIDIDRMIQLLMWYGFLGVAKSDQRKIYIFDRGYVLRRLLADRDAKIEDTMYCVNPAFLRGLAD